MAIKVIEKENAFKAKKQLSRKEIDQKTSFLTNKISSSSGVEKKQWTNQLLAHQKMFGIGEPPAVLASDRRIKAMGAK